MLSINLICYRLGANELRLVDDYLAHSSAVAKKSYRDVNAEKIAAVGRMIEELCAAPGGAEQVTRM